MQNLCSVLIFLMVTYTLMLDYRAVLDLANYSKVFIGKSRISCQFSLDQGQVNNLAKHLWVEIYQKSISK